MCLGLSRQSIKSRDGARNWINRMEFVYQDLCIDRCIRPTGSGYLGQPWISRGGKPRIWSAGRVLGVGIFYVHTCNFVSKLIKTRQCYCISMIARVSRTNLHFVMRISLAKRMWLSHSCHEK